MNVKQRILALEEQDQARPLTERDIRKSMDDLYQRHGMTREQVIAKYGSESEFAYRLMCEGIPTDAPESDMPPAERYLRMIGK